MSQGAVQADRIGPRPAGVAVRGLFKAYGAVARAKGFLQVASSPLTRSSYHAGDDFAAMRAARQAQLAKGR